jgi:RNA polymerase sigma-70 factor, ECF subfamily
MRRLGLLQAVPSERGADATLEAVLAGDERAQSELFQRHAPEVERLLSRILGRDGELRDLVQEVFVRAFERLEQLDDPSKLRAWIVAIAVFVARERIRSRRRKWWLVLVPHHAVEELTGSDAPNPDRDVADATYRVMDRLPAEERIALALRVIDGRELTEVAEACGVSLATIKRRLVKAQERFRLLASNEPALSPWARRGGP